MDISPEIRGEMVRRSVTRDELLSHLGIARSAFTERMQGRVDFRLGEVVEIASALGTTASDLIARAEQRMEEAA